MKKLFIAAIAVLSFGAVSAQENAVKVNPLALLGGTDLLSYERKINENSSAVLGLGFSTYKFGGAEYTSTGAELQYRYYFGEALKDWYAGAQVGYSVGKLKQDYSGFGFGGTQPDDIKYSDFRLGAKGGYQWLFGSGFVIDLNLGIAYTKFGYTDTSSNASFVNGLKGSGIFPTFGFGLGYAF